MKTIKNNISNEIIIKNSKFITKLIKVNNIDEIDNHLLTIKDKYKDATHYCYGYIIDNIKRSSDDGEPSGTAGMPILNVLEKNDLNYVLCIVIRYFGGIKLGAGGLIRAYSKSVVNALNQSKLIKLKKGYEIIMEIDYADIKKIDYLLKECTIVSKEFNNKITYKFHINLEKFEEIKNKFDNYNIKKRNILI